MKGNCNERVEIFEGNERRDYLGRSVFFRGGCWELCERPTAGRCENHSSCETVDRSAPGPGATQPDLCRDTRSCVVPIGYGGHAPGIHGSRTDCSPNSWRSSSREYDLWGLRCSIQGSLGQKCCGFTFIYPIEAPPGGLVPHDVGTVSQAYGRVAIRVSVASAPARGGAGVPRVPVDVLRPRAVTPVAELLKMAVRATRRGLWRHRP